jgi:hypothetical protein
MSDRNSPSILVPRTRRETETAVDTGGEFEVLRMFRFVFP